jgi:AraC-like DNA-binding protein
MDDRSVAGTTVLHAASLVSLLGFRCPPGDRRWSEENRADDGHLIVFPATSVWIAQAGGSPIVTDRNLVVLYNRNVTFRRALASDEGDRCTVVVPSPALLEAIASVGGLPIGDVERRPFALDRLPCPDDVYLAHRMVVARAIGSGDPLMVDCALIRLVELVLDAKPPADAGSGPRRPGTLRAHAELVEQAKARLGQSLDRPLALDTLAADLATAPYHLARVFRAATGASLHEYRDRLRLRASLDRILEGHESLTRIGLDAGYASASHFSDRFRRRFGVSPSTVRHRTVPAA